MRLYAEDPAADWQPQSGTLTRFEVPDVTEAVRVDAGFESGNEVSTHYDAMLAKVIAWAPTREAGRPPARRRPRRRRIHGVVTNRDLLVGDPADPEFLAGGSAPAFLAADFEARRRARGSTTRRAVAAAIALAERSRRTRPSSPASRSPGATWCRSRSARSSTATSSSSGGAAATATPSTASTVVAAGATAVTLEVDGVRTPYDVSVSGDAVDVDSPRGHVRLARVPRFVDPADAVASGSLLAPMPGTVVTVAVATGRRGGRGRPSWSSRP